MSNPEPTDDPQDRPTASKPDGGLNDGAAAMAMMALAIVVIVVVVLLL